MKKLLMILLMISLCGCTTQTTPEPTAKPTGAAGCDISAECDTMEPADMSAYEAMVGNNHFVKADMKEVTDMFDKGETFIFYVGFNKCPWCQEEVPVLNEVAEGYDDVKIMYVDARPDGEKENDLRNEENPDYVALQEKVEEILDETRKIYAPTVVWVKEGKLVASHVGTVDDHDAHERKMTEEEVETLRDTYTKCFDTFVGNE